MPGLQGKDEKEQRGFIYQQIRRRYVRDKVMDNGLSVRNKKVQGSGMYGMGD